jgi:hypothetical protein
MTKFIPEIEDRHGGFLIKTINEQDINWLNNADDYTE